MSSPISIFVSYAHEDKSLARQLAQSLTAYNLTVWIDEGELMVGDSMIDRISSALASVQFVVAIVSPASINSQWCKKELSMAMTGGLQRKGVKVLPLRVGPTPMPPALNDVFYLQLESWNLEDVASKLVLAAMRHSAEHQVAQRLASGEHESPAVSAEKAHPTAEIHDSSTDYGSRLQDIDSPHENRGIVKWFNAEKGFGFITSESGQDLFVHFSELEGEGYRTLNEGQRVSFTRKLAPNGNPMAVNVRVIRT